MELPQVETRLQHPPDRVRRAVLNGELQPFFKKSGWLAQGSVAAHIQWHEAADGSLLGKLGYFRAKHFSVFRFAIRLEPLDTGALATVEARHGPYSQFLRIMLYIVGICLCVVGVGFSYLGDKAIQHGLRKIVEYLWRHLEAWDGTSDRADATDHEVPPSPSSSS